MEQRQRKSECLGYFHLARGLGMILIVAGHSVNLFYSPGHGYGLFAGAGSVLGGGIIAMFFMISGFGFYRRSPGKCFSIQKKLLLRPYYLTAAAVLATKLLLAIGKKRSFLEHGGELILTYLFGLNAEGGGSFLGIPIESVSILWFLLALFGGWILYNQIMQFRSENLQAVMILLCILCSFVLIRLSKVWPFCFPMGLQAVGYLAAGDQIRKRNLLEKKLPVWMWGLLILGTAAAAFGEVNMVAGIWRFGLLDLAGSFCVGFLLLRLYAGWKNRVDGGKVTAVIEEIGFCSIWVVCLHAYEKIIFPWHRLAWIFPDQPWLCVILGFCGRCVVMYLMYLILVFGKRKWKRWKKKRRKVRITK
ncbi:MAG: acyltransferase [Fusicatenibacter sp.]|nr:acyltransferase [Fusicatenibacter sp.]